MKMTANNSQLAKTQTVTLQTMMEQRKSFLAEVLPHHMKPERMIKVALAARSRNPKLLECTAESFLKAFLQCAEMGLEPTGSGGAHLVPFKNNKTGKMEVQTIPDWRGLRDLALRTGTVTKIWPHVVYERDTFKRVLGTEPVISHEPAPDADPGAVVGVYAVAYFSNGAAPMWEYMNVAQVERIRARSRARDSGPWVTDYEAMAIKTVVKKLCKLLPQSRELSSAINLDDANERGFDAEIDLALPDDVVTEAAPQLPAEATNAERAKAALKPSRLKIEDESTPETSPTPSA
jgi:recombination protein RecT